MPQGQAWRPADAFIDRPTNGLLDDERTRTLLDDEHTWLSKPFGFRDVREFLARLCQGGETETE